MSFATSFQLANSTAIYGWDYRPSQIIGFLLLCYFFLCIISALSDAVTWNCKGLANSSDWIDLLIWGCLPSLWLYRLPDMIHLYSFLVYVPVQLSILAVLVMYYWISFSNAVLYHFIDLTDERAAWERRPFWIWLIFPDIKSQCAKIFTVNKGEKKEQFNIAESRFVEYDQFTCNLHLWLKNQNQHQIKTKLISIPVPPVSLQ